MSGYANISAAPDQNILYQAASGQTLLANQRNQLMNQEAAALMPYKVQEAQQQVGNADMEVAARVAGTLMDPTLYPTTEARAAAYPGLISQWQARGYLKNAPSVYPGDAQAQALARMGVSSSDQYQWSMGRAANQALVPSVPGAGAGGGGAQGGGGGAGGGGGVPPPGGNYGAGGPGSSIQVPAAYMPFYKEASERTGIPIDVLIAKDRQESGFNPNAKGKAGEIGIAQIMPSTALAPGYGMQPIDPSKLTDPRTNINFGADYLKARMRGDPNDPEAMRRGLFAYNAGGDPNYVANVTRYLPASAGTAVAGAAPPAAPGSAPARFPPGTVQAAGPAVGTPRAAPGAAGTPPAVSQPPTVPQPPQNTLAPPPAAPPAAAPAATPPAQQPPDATQPPPAPAFQPPPAVPRPPAPPTIVADGLTAGQIQDLNAMAARPGFSTATLAQRKYEYQQQNIQQANTYRAALEKERADAIQTQTAQAQVGNLALETWKAAHPDAKVTTVGGEIITQDPRTGAEIAPRIPVTPDRPEAMAMVTLGRLASKIQSGQPLTPQEQSDYNVAYQMIGKPTIQEDPLTKRKFRTYTTDMSGFPSPPGTSGDGTQTITPGMSISQQAAEKKAGDDFVDRDSKSYSSANNSLISLGEMNHAAEVMDRTPGGWTATGPGANLRLGLGQKLNQVAGLFGFDPLVDPNAVGSWELLNKQTKLMGFKMVNAAFGGSREAASVIQNATSAVPGAENTYLGFRLVSSAIEQELARERQLYEYKSQLMNQGKPMAGAEADFNKTHPADAYTQRAVANAVPDDVASYLVRNPTQAAITTIDQKFGSGIAKFILGGGRTGMGSEAARTQ